MDQLQWTRRETGWRAGRYSIELISPGFWVLSRFASPQATEDVKILASSSSRSILVATAAQLEITRKRRRRVVVWSGVFMSSIAVLVWAYFATLSWASTAVVASSTLAVFASIRVLDSLVDRAWESIKSTYQ